MDYFPLMILSTVTLHEKKKFAGLYIFSVNFGEEFPVFDKNFWVRE